MLRENELLNLIAARNTALPEAVTIPPGDDMAGIRVGDTELLVAVDPVIEGVHFDRAVASLQQVGRKAITRNLSDVAAMAAKPVAVVVAATLPRGMPPDDAAALFEALRQTALHYRCPLIGGDTSVHDGPLTLTATVLAEPAGIAPVRRGTAQPADALYVTGALGNSAAGHHLDFEPRLGVARALAADPATRPTAMIDVSDGLAQDLPRLCNHAVVDVDRLPIRAGTPDPTWQHALGDGEDYELLFTASESMPAEVDGVPLTRIGEVRDTGGVVFLDVAGQLLDASGLGWEHRG